MGLVVPIYALNVDLASDWFSLRTAELPPYKIETIQNAWSPSTNFTQESSQSSVTVILAFRTWCTGERLFLSSRITAISACHVGFEGNVVGQYPF